jgi:hypothetical protein
MSALDVGDELMKVGDLVKFFSDESDYAGQVGLVTRVRPVSEGFSDRVEVYVQWPSGYTSYPERQLVVINGSR